MNKLILIILSILSLVNLYLGQSSTKTNSYSKLSEVNSFDLDSSFILNSFVSNTNLNCLSSCTKTPECFYTVFQKNKCFICQSNFIGFASYNANGNSLINRKKLKISEGLINYWTFDGNVNDVVGNANLYDGVNASLTTDRFGIANSALSLSKGHYRVPPDVYFSGIELTIMAWVNLKSIPFYSRLIDFGNGEFNENIVLVLSSANSSKPYIFLKAGVDQFSCDSLHSLNLNHWQNLAFIFSFPNLFIYIDGNVTTAPASSAPLTSFSLANVVRSSNFIGRSNWNGDENLDADADFDDLKIFNRALSQ
jgi:hypothetical protein